MSTKGQMVTKKNDKIIFLDLNSLAELNFELQNNLDICPGGEQEVYTKFYNYILLNQSIDIYNYTSIWNYHFQLELNKFKGFVADRFQLVTMSFISYTNIVLKQGAFDFYNKHGELLGPSCASYLKSYYELSDQEYLKANKSKLLEDYIGLFSITVPYFYMNSLISFSNPICPLIYKSSFFEMTLVIKLENTRLQKPSSYEKS